MQFAFLGCACAHSTVAVSREMRPTMFRPWAWISGGVGFALYQEASDGGSFGSSAGAGFDLRIGVSLGLGAQSRHRLGMWLEAIPAAYRYIARALPPPAAEWDVFMSTTLNIGYQIAR